MAKQIKPAARRRPTAGDVQQRMRVRLNAAMDSAAKPSSATTRVLGIDAIESVIAGSAPNIGLQLFAAQEFLFNSLTQPRFAAINPIFIGIPALLWMRPGMSQKDVADLMGLERAPAGVHVKQCLQQGLIRRDESTQDARKYRLFVTAKGLAYLREVARLIPAHEDFCYGMLSSRERGTLYRLLKKVVTAQSKEDWTVTPLGFGAAARRR